MPRLPGNRCGCGPALSPWCCSGWLVRPSTRSYPRSRSTGCVRARRRTGDRRVVACSSAAHPGWSAGRPRGDGARGVRDIAHRSPVHCERGDDDRLARDPRPEPRPGRLGGGQPTPLQRTSARVHGCRDNAGVRSVHARAHRWDYRRRRSDLHWRWTPTPEQRLLAQAGDEPAAPVSSGSGSCRCAELPAPMPLRQQRSSREAPAPRRCQQRARSRSGLAFADPIATASFAACGSRPIGPSRRRLRCGAGRSDRAGLHSRSTATSSIPRSSAVTKRSSLATT